MGRPRRPVNPNGGRPRHELLGHADGLRAALHRDRGAVVAALRFYPVSAVCADRIRHPVEHLLRGAGAGLWVFLCHRAGLGQGICQPVAAGTGGLVYLPVSGLAALHPVLFCLQPVRVAAARWADDQPDLRGTDGRDTLADPRLGWGDGGAVPQHLRLCRRDLLWRAALRPQGRSGGSGCLWLFRVGEVPADHMAHYAAAGLARLYE